ncbi:MAG TPA: sugar transferase [Vicinamibacterales bacterium]
MMASMPNRKRLFDLAGGAAGLLVFAPILVVVAGAILLEDGTPILFRQDRLGRSRMRFTIFKFRSMRDGRITRVGRILRATGLDELPQFVNILRGEMSAVGPRPLTESDVTRLGWATRPYDFRWRLSPGLTGLAQVIGSQAGRRSLALDRRYVRRPSLWLDLQLVLISFVVNLLGKQRVRLLLERRRRTTRGRWRGATIRDWPA